MERLRGFFFSTALMASVTAVSVEARADNPVAFRDTDFSTEERQVIEWVLMHPETEDPLFGPPVDVGFVHFIMRLEGLSKLEALEWLRDNWVAVAHHDLTGDGIAELLVMFYHSSLHGTGGTPTVILERTPDGWRYLTDIDAYAAGIWDDPPPPYPLCVSDTRLNGRPYFYSLEAVRYWNGKGYNWDCVTRCEESLPENHSIGQRISQDLGCIFGE